MNLTASNLTLYSVPPPGSEAVLAAIVNIIQHSDNFQVCKGHAAPDHQQPDHVQRAAIRRYGLDRRKIRLKKGNAKCCHPKNLPVKGLSGRCLSV
jgi:hypothetical protein